MTVDIGFFAARTFINETRRPFLDGRQPIDLVSSLHWLQITIDSFLLLPIVPNIIHPLWKPLKRRRRLGSEVVKQLGVSRQVEPRFLDDETTCRIFSATAGGILRHPRRLVRESKVNIVSVSFEWRILRVIRTKEDVYLSPIIHHANGKEPNVVA